MVKTMSVILTNKIKIQEASKPVICDVIDEKGRLRKEIVWPLKR